MVADHFEERVVQGEQGDADRALRLGVGGVRVCGAGRFVAPGQERERAGKEGEEILFHTGLVDAWLTVGVTDCRSVEISDGDERQVHPEGFQGVHRSSFYSHQIARVNFNRSARLRPGA